MISVIVPVYNCQQYLAECVNSILGQSFTDLELILVNDGSTDRSLEICEDYKNKDPRVVVIDKPNGGVSSARNAGMAVANGEFLSFIDGDDYIDKTMLEKLHRAAVNHKADLCICKRIIPGKRQNYGHDYPVGRAFDFSEREQNWKRLYYQGDIETFVTNKLFSRSLIENAGVSFQKYPLFEDRLFLQQLYIYGCKMLYIAEDLYFYRVVEGSAVRRYCGQRYEIVVKNFEYDLQLDAAYDRQRYKNAVFAQFADMVIGCINQEKNNSFSVQIQRFEQIRQSEQFSKLYTALPVLQLPIKKTQQLLDLSNQKYKKIYRRNKRIYFWERVKMRVKYFGHRGMK